MADIWGYYDAVFYSDLQRNSQEIVIQVCAYLALTKQLILFI